VVSTVNTPSEFVYNTRMGAVWWNLVLVLVTLYYNVDIVTGKCASDEFQCKDEITCVPRYKVCDGHPDCPQNERSPGGEDEEEECGSGLSDPYDYETSPENDGGTGGSVLVGPAVGGKDLDPDSPPTFLPAPESNSLVGPVVGVVIAVLVIGALVGLFIWKRVLNC